jgi:hypothetical protein
MPTYGYKWLSLLPVCALLLEDPSVPNDVHTKDLSSSGKESQHVAFIENPQTGTIKTYARWQTFLGTGFFLKFYKDDIFPLQGIFYLAFRWVTRVLRGNITARNLK